MMPLRTEYGETVGLLKILGGCTDQREAGAALEASEFRYRSLVEVSPQVVWFGDIDGNVTYCNAYWYDYTGLPAGETGEASWMEVIHPDHRESTRAAWLAAAGSGQPYEVEFPLRRADGQYRCFLSRARPVRDEAGMLASWIGTSIDIHERIDGRPRPDDLRGMLRRDAMPDEREPPEGVPPATEDISLLKPASPGRLPPPNLPPAPDPAAPRRGDAGSDGPGPRNGHD